MDILDLIDRLEELFNESRAIPFTHNVIVDEEKMLDLIDQMRVAIPEEMKKAQQVMTQRDRILAQAQEEANRTLALAREKGEQLLERDDRLRVRAHAQQRRAHRGEDLAEVVGQRAVTDPQYVGGYWHFAEPISGGFRRIRTPPTAFRPPYWIVAQSR